MPEESSIEQSGASTPVKVTEPVASSGVTTIHGPENTNPFGKNLHSKDAVEPSTEDSGMVTLPSKSPSNWGESDYGAAVRAKLLKGKGEKHAA